MPKEAESHEDKNKREQMEWGRLQREALAAQRYRLEQEIEQARAQGLIADDASRDDPFMGIHWSYKWIVTGAVVLLTGGVAVVALLV